VELNIIGKYVGKKFWPNYFASEPHSLFILFLRDTRVHTVQLTNMSRFAALDLSSDEESGNEVRRQFLLIIQIDSSYRIPMPI
jgi:hypothetical protein